MEVTVMEPQALMKGFPPPAGLQVTLANWRKPPFNKWSFQHVREIIPSAEISNGHHNVRQLPSARHSFSELVISDEAEAYGLDPFLRATDTDGFIVLRDGNILYEFY